MRKRDDFEGIMIAMTCLQLQPGSILWSGVLKAAAVYISSFVNYCLTRCSLRSSHRLHPPTSYVKRWYTRVNSQAVTQVNIHPFEVDRHKTNLNGMCWVFCLFVCLGFFFSQTKLHWITSIIHCQTALENMLEMLRTSVFICRSTSKYISYVTNWWLQTYRHIGHTMQSSQYFVIF